MNTVHDIYFDHRTITFFYEKEKTTVIASAYQLLAIFTKLLTHPTFRRRRPWSGAPVSGPKSPRCRVDRVEERDEERGTPINNTINNTIWNDEYTASTRPKLTWIVIQVNLGRCSRNDEKERVLRENLK
jgi:hypothetical protein